MNNVVLETERLIWCEVDTSLSDLLILEIPNAEHPTHGTRAIRRARATFSETRLYWSVIAIISAVDLVWMWHDSIQIAAQSTLRFSLAPALFLSFAWFLRLGQPSFVKSSVARACSVLGRLGAFTIVILPLDYLIESLGMPLFDNFLRSIDAALGFDWQLLTDFIYAHGNLAVVLAGAIDKRPFCRGGAGRQTMREVEQPICLHRHALAFKA